MTTVIRKILGYFGLIFSKLFGKFEPGVEAKILTERRRIFMGNEHIEITLSKEKIREIINAWYIIGDFLETLLPREALYQKSFQLGLEKALEEVESGQARKVTSFDEFTR